MLALLFTLIDWFAAPRWGLTRFLWSECHFHPGSTALFELAMLGLILLAIAIRVGPNLDMFLLDVPIVGYFYERYFRTITFWRIDRMVMYQQAVHAAVIRYPLRRASLVYGLS